MQAAPKLETQETHVNGVEFRVNSLQPFGEIWVPADGQQVAVDEWVTREPKKVVYEVKRAKVVAIENTAVNQYWRSIPPDENSELPHIDDTADFGDLILHALHSPDGSRLATSYAQGQALTLAARKNIGILKDLLADAPDWLKLNYGLDQILENFEHPEGAYHLLPGIIDPYSRMQADIMQWQQILHGSTWMAHIDINEIAAKLPVLIRGHAKLRKFYLRVAQDTKKYPHHWERHPGSTVLSYQDTKARFTAPNSLINHFRERVQATQVANTGSRKIESNLRRNFLLSRATRYDGFQYDWAHNERTARQFY